MRWYTDLGIRPDHLQLRAHGEDELSHYSSATSDIEYLFPMGWSELEGIANRGDFDLTQHAKFSGEKLEYVDSATGDRYVPHVIEPAAGVDRAMLAFMVDAYDEEEVEGRERTVLRLHPRLAPVKVAVLPLVNKDGQPEKAREIYEQLRERDAGRVRHRRLDRQALPPPGRDRHPLGHHRRPPDDGGRHRHPARPRLARPVADRDRRARRRAASRLLAEPWKSPKLAVEQRCIPRLSRSIRTFKQERPGEPGAERRVMGQPVVHFEVVGKDADGMRDYYGDLFGWKFETVEGGPTDYSLINREENVNSAGIGIGGGMGAGPEGYDGHVTFYVEVPDVEAALAKAEELGGTRVMGPESPGGGVEIGLFNDPEDHLIGVVKGGWAES